MSSNIPGSKPAERPRVQIYDPPMCCPTGLCGPTVDPVLLDIHEAVITLKAEGITAQRYMLSSQPQAFFANSEVMKLCQGETDGGLADSSGRRANSKDRSISDAGRTKTRAVYLTRDEVNGA